MDMTIRTYDSLHMGRSSIDLYANDVGSPFEEIGSFAALVGGSPTNISVGVRRLGLNSVLLTGLGNDPVGDFVKHFLDKEKVVTEFIPRKGEHRTSAVILGIEPPDKFPLVFYRENCADTQISIDDVLAAPIADCRLFQFAGTNLSKEPCRSATFFAAEIARRNNVEVLLDIDFRPNQWHDPRAFGVAIRAILPTVDIVIGTDDEINAATLMDPDQINVTHSQISDARVSGDIDEAIDTLLGMGPKVLIQKRGDQGVRVHEIRDDGVREQTDVPGFPVEIYNILGAGDAFGAGFVCGHLSGMGYYKSARLGNACGAIVVTKHGCANSMPDMDEVLEFAKGYGGL